MGSTPGPARARAGGLLAAAVLTGALAATGAVAVVAWSPMAPAPAGVLPFDAGSPLAAPAVVPVGGPAVVPQTDCPGSYLTTQDAGTSRPAAIPG